MTDDGIEPLPDNVIPLRAEVAPVDLPPEARVIPVKDAAGLPVSWSMAIPGVASTVATAAMSSGEVYKMVASPEILKGIADGTLKLDSTARGVVSDVRNVVSGNYAGKAEFTRFDGDLAKGATAALGAFQLVSFAVGQYHLMEIQGSLAAIEVAVGGLDQRFDSLERRALIEAEDTMRSVVSHVERGNDIYDDRIRIDSARRAAVGVFDEALQRAAKGAEPVAIVAAGTRRGALDQQRRRVAAARRELIDEDSRLERLVDRTRETLPVVSRSPSDDRAATNQHSDAIDAVVEELRALEERISADMTAESSAGEVTRDLKSAVRDGAGCRALVDALELATRAAQLVTILSTLSVIAESDDGRREAEAQESQRRIAGIAERLSALPARVVDDLPQALSAIKADGEVLSKWRTVEIAGRTAAEVGTLMSAAALDELILRASDDGQQLDLCRLVPPTEQLTA